MLMNALLSTISGAARAAEAADVGAARSLINTSLRDSLVPVLRYVNLLRR